MLRFKLRERIADLEFKERRRIPIQDVATATGLSRMTLSKLINEHGANVQTDVLDKLCSFLGCRIEDLVEHVEASVHQEEMMGNPTAARGRRPA